MHVTKRTERLRLAGVSAAALAALVLGGCGGVTSTNRPAAAADDEPAASATVPPPAATEATTIADASPAVSVQPQATTRATARATAQATTKTVTETKPIGFATRTVNDSSLAKGVRKTRTAGVAGVRTLTYRVTYAGGAQTSKTLVKTVVTRAPVTKVVAVGTKAAASSKCDPNYSGCVPIASDVDCAGGSGNGPAYVTGPIRVIGTDIYHLDSDGDGIACES